MNFPRYRSRSFSTLPASASRRNARSISCARSSISLRICPSGSSTQHHIDMDTMRSAARPQIAKLINADEDDIALVESTTHGLNLVANAIPLQHGDRVIISRSGVPGSRIALASAARRNRHCHRCPTEPRRNAAGARRGGRDYSRHSRRRSQFRAVEQRLSLRSRWAFTPVPRPRRHFDRGCYSADRRHPARRTRDSGGRAGLRWAQVAVVAIRLRLSVSQQRISRQGESAAGGISFRCRAGRRLGNVFRDALHLAGRRLRVSYIRHGAGRTAARQIIRARSGWPSPSA